MQMNPYLTFNGQCEAAFKFYEKCLGAKITFMMPHEGTPVANDVPSDWRNKILHASLQVGDRLLQGADCPPDYYQKPAGFSVKLDPKDAAEAERVFSALAKMGRCKCRFQETFWAVLRWYARGSIRYPVDD